jgi:hypothetical protein
MVTKQINERILRIAKNTGVEPGPARDAAIEYCGKMEYVDQINDGILEQIFNSYYDGYQKALQAK